MVMYTVNRNVCEYFESIGEDPRNVVEKGSITIFGYERFMTDAHGERVVIPRTNRLMREFVPWTTRRYLGFLFARMLDKLEGTSRPR